MLLESFCSEEIKRERTARGGGCIEYLRVPQPLNGAFYFQTFSIASAFASGGLEPNSSQKTLP